MLVTQSNTETPNYSYQFWAAYKQKVVVGGRHEQQLIWSIRIEVMSVFKLPWDIWTIERTSKFQILDLFMYMDNCFRIIMIESDWNTWCFIHVVKSPIDTLEWPNYHNDTLLCTVVLNFMSFYKLFAFLMR